jgi:hypothetical protein
MAERLINWQGIVVDRIGTGPGSGDHRSEVPSAVSLQLERLRQVEERLADLAKSVPATDLQMPAELPEPEAVPVDEPEPVSEASTPRSRRWRGSRRKSRI